MYLIIIFVLYTLNFLKWCISNIEEKKWCGYHALYNFYKSLSTISSSRVHYILGLANLADSSGDISFIMERVSNMSQDSEPQFLHKVPGTIFCDSHDFHLLVTWESENQVQALSRLILSEYFPDRCRSEVQNLFSK